MKPLFNWLYGFVNLNKNETYQIGKAGEALAQKYLKKLGWKILSTGYRDGKSEADIIALHPKKFIVIVEVKTSTNTLPNHRPEKRVSKAQQKRLRKIGRKLLQCKQLPQKVRHDVIAIVLTDPPTLRHHQGAF